MILRLVPLVILFVLALVVYRRIVNSHWLRCWIAGLVPAPETDDEVIRHLDAERAANERAAGMEMEATKKREAAEAIRRRTKRA